MRGLMERAGCPVALVEAGLAHWRQRWDPPLLVGEEALFSSGSPAVECSSGTAGSGSSDAEIAVLQAVI